MPVYHTAAYEFETAKDMTDAFCGRVLAPDYSRVMNPTVMHLEETVKALTGATNVFAFCSGMAAITNALLVFVEQGKNIVTSNHLFGNTVALMNRTLTRFGVETRQIDRSTLMPSAMPSTSIQLASTSKSLPTHNWKWLTYRHWLTSLTRRAFHSSQTRRLSPSRS